MGDKTDDDSFWKYEVESTQRGGVTGAVNSRRYGEETTLEGSDGPDPNDEHDEDEGGFDKDGIPTGI